MGLTLVTPSSGVVVSTEAAKTFCRIDGSDDDAAVAELVASASELVSSWLGRSLLSQTWRLSIDRFADEILLPRGPVQSVSSIKYSDIDGVEQTLDPAIYTDDLASDPQRILRDVDAAWPAVQRAPNAVRIEYVAGYSTVPAGVALAIKLLVSDWFDNRGTFAIGSVGELPHRVEDLLCNHRSFTGA